jgi:hypothetical protein
VLRIRIEPHHFSLLEPEPEPHQNVYIFEFCNTVSVKIRFRGGLEEVSTDRIFLNLPTIHIKIYRFIPKQIPAPCYSVHMDNLIVNNEIV